MSIIDNRESYNYGLAILRLWMVFEIILCHCWRNRGTDNLLLVPFEMYTHVAAPVFMCLSFYLMEDKLRNCNRDGIKKRVYRIIYPHIIWLVIYLIFRLLINFTMNQKMNIFREIGLQLFFGSSEQLNAAMWFQISLLIITVLLFLCIQFIRGGKPICIYCVLAILGFALEYFKFLSPVLSLLPHEIEIFCGRTIEMIPLAMLGCILASFTNKNTVEISKHHIFHMLGCVIGIVALFVFGNKISVEGYSYSGIDVALISMITVFLFSRTTCGKLNKHILSVIYFCSSCSLGVYCMHNMVGLIFGKIFEKTNLPAYSFGFSIMIYFICFMISIVVSQIPNKNVRDAVI